MCVCVCVCVCVGVCRCLWAIIFQLSASRCAVAAQQFISLPPPFSLLGAPLPPPPLCVCVCVCGCACYCDVIVCSRRGGSDVTQVSLAKSLIQREAVSRKGGKGGRQSEDRLAQLLPFSPLARLVSPLLLCLGCFWGGGGGGRRGGVWAKYSPGPHILSQIETFFHVSLPPLPSLSLSLSLSLSPLPPLSLSLCYFGASLMYIGLGLPKAQKGKPNGWRIFCWAGRATEKMQPP